MRRVYIVWFARRVVNSVTLKLLAILALVTELRQYSSVKHVLYNSPSFLHVAETIGFWSHAFIHASAMAELLMMTIGALAVLTARDYLSRRTPVTFFPGSRLQ